MHILIVDSHPGRLNEFRQALEYRGIDVTHACSLSTARLHYQAHASDLSVIVFDGYLRCPGYPLDSTRQPSNTAPLVREWREAGSTALMVACSDDEEQRRELLAAGCDDWLPPDQVSPSTMLTLHRRRDRAVTPA